MRLRWKTLALLCLLELTLLAAAHGDHAHAHGGEENAAASMSDDGGEPVYYSNVTAHSSSGHSHGGHMHAGAPKTVLNEVRFPYNSSQFPIACQSKASCLFSRLAFSYTLGLWQPASVLDSHGMTNIITTTTTTV